MRGLDEKSLQIRSHFSQLGEGESAL